MQTIILYQSDAKHHFQQMTCESYIMVYCKKVCLS